jgi:hypothetical protein
VGSCVTIDLPGNAHLDFSGNAWSCDLGFSHEGRRCLPDERVAKYQAAPSVAHDVGQPAALTRGRPCDYPVLSPATCLRTRTPSNGS